VELVNSDYADFVVVPAHLKSDTKAIEWGNPNGGGHIPSVNGGVMIPAIGMPAITGPDEEPTFPPLTYAEAAAAAAVAAGGTPSVAAPVIGMHNLISIPKSPLMIYKYGEQ